MNSKIVRLIGKILPLAILTMVSLSQAAPCPFNLTPPDNTATVVMSQPWGIGYPANDMSAEHNASSISNYVTVGNAAIPSGYYPGWCVDSVDDLAFDPTVYGALMFSTCDSNLVTYLQALGLGYPASVYADPLTWKKVNYILNHRSGVYFWNVQVALWSLVGGPADPALLTSPYPPIDWSIVSQLLADADANAQIWDPACGDVLAVVIVVPSWNYLVQLSVIEVPVPCAPCIKVTKTIACLNPNITLAEFGEMASGFKGSEAPGFAYAITVTNCGSATLTNLSVIDSMFGDITTNLFSPLAVLPPGGSATYCYAASIDVNTTNVVVVSGTSVDDGTPVQSTDSSVALVDQASINATLTLSSSCDQDGKPSDNHVLLPGCSDGCSVTYKLTVCNTGAADLDNVTLLVSNWPGSQPAPFSLAAGECKSFEGSVFTQCPGKTVKINITGRLKADENHCGIYGITGTNILCVGTSTSGTITCGPTAGSICGHVFLDCDGNGNLTGDDAGLVTVVTLKTLQNSIIATTRTDTNGTYCFENLAPGTYKVVVTSPAGYTQTAGSCKPQWKDKYGRPCWIDNDNCSHWKEADLDCWLGKDGFKHWKDSNGRDCWKDLYGYSHSQPCSFTSCNAPKNNEEIVCLSACETETVNFAYKGTAHKAVCTVKGPSWVRCGESAFYTVTVTNTGNGCFSDGCKVTVCGRTYSCPPLAPGECYNFTVKCSFSWWDSGNYNCKATAVCFPHAGSPVYAQSECSTWVRW